MFYLNNQLYWIDLLKEERKQDCTHVDHTSSAPLSFKIIYINIVQVFL